MSSAHHRGLSRTRRGRSRLLSTGAATAVLALASTAAHAQSTAAVSDASVGEVIVTAERRETTLQETPVAVSAFGRDQIETQRMLDVRSFVAQVPSFYQPNRAYGATDSFFSIRGVNFADIFFESPVAVYVDGIYRPSALGSNRDTPDVDRVEVLRGPQGTLYGRNSAAGAVNYYTRGPTFQFGGFAEGWLGSYNETAGRLFVDIPIVDDTVGASISALYNKRDGYTHSVTTGRDYNDLDYNTVRGKLRIKPTDKLDILFSVEHSKDQSASIVTPLNQPDGRPGGTSYDPDLTWAAGTPSLDSTVNGGSSTVTYSASDHLVLKSLTSYFRSKGTWETAFDDGQSIILNNSYITFGYKQLSQELQALGTFGALHTTAGLFYSDTTLTQGRIGQSGTPIAGIGNEYKQLANRNSHSIALYGQADYTILSKLTLTLGGRYTWDNWNYDDAGFRASNVMLNRNILILPAPDPGSEFAVTQNGSSSAFTPRAGLKYDWSPSLMTYASYSRGYLAGGPDIRASRLILAQQQFDDEFITAYEVGTRGQFFDKRLALSLTGYFQRIHNQQVSAFDQVIKQQRVFNAAESEAKGIEFEATMAPTRRLRLQASFSYIDAQYTKFTATLPANPTGATTLVGLAPPFTPKYMVGGQISYELPLANNGSLTFSGDGRFTTKAYSDLTDTEQAAYPQQAMFNASVSYKPKTDGPWTLTFRVENLTDNRKGGAGSVVPTDGPYGGLTDQPNPPRMFTGILRYDF